MNQVGFNLVRIALIIRWRGHNEKKPVLKYRNKKEKQSSEDGNDTGDKLDLQARMMRFLDGGQENAPQVGKKETCVCYTLDFVHVASVTVN